VLEFDADGLLIEIDIDQASKVVDLSQLEADGLRIAPTGRRYGPRRLRR
jgi:hypothetical protein